MHHIYIDPIQLQLQEKSTTSRIIQALCNPSGGYKLKGPEEIVFISKLGSRLWGTFTNSSDFDCLVVHSCETNKAVRHIGASIASASSSSADKIDVRLESVESFIEQMKTGSIRCWLAFLLILSEIKTVNNNNNDDDDDDDENEEEQEYLKDYSSIQFQKQPSLVDFIAHVIASVKVLNFDLLLQKLSETLAEDEQRVVKLIASSCGDDDEHDEAENVIQKAVKIMKHSFRLVLSAMLIASAMTPNNNSNNDEKAESKKSKATNNKSNQSGKGNLVLNAFQSSIDLKRDVFGIEDQMKRSAQGHLLFSTSGLRAKVTADAVRSFYDPEKILHPLITMARR